MNLFQRCLHGVAHVCGTSDNPNTGSFHRRHLFLRSLLAVAIVWGTWDTPNPGTSNPPLFFLPIPLPPRHDCARVSHSPSRRCGLSANKSDDRLLHVGLDVSSGFLFRGTTDFS